MSGLCLVDVDILGVFHLIRWIHQGMKKNTHVKLEFRYFNYKESWSLKCLCLSKETTIKSFPRDLFSITIDKYIEALIRY